MNEAAVRILLVEDSLSDAVLLQESLSENGAGGFEFTHAESWKEAAAHLRNQRFDVLLLDLSLPDITGPRHLCSGAGRGAASAHRGADRRGG